MKIYARLAVVALLAIEFMIGCGKRSDSTQNRAAPNPKRAVPIDHSVDAENRLVATDLAHGSGPMRLNVTREWNGADTLNTHFGQGWSDRNLVRLTMIDRNLVLIWRGGTGWNTAQRKGEKLFEGDAGEKIQQTDKGWTAQMPHGVTLIFDSNGRLTSEKPAAGPACNYVYDNKGQLISVGTGSDNFLKYRYDKQGRRVTSVDGPEGLRLEYSYDDKGRLAAVTNSRKVRIGYLYGDTGKLVAAQDEFGNQLDARKIVQGIATTKRRKAATSAVSLAGPLPRTKYNFDEQGRIKGATRQGESASYQYNDAGQMESISAPSGRASCKYDSFGRIASVQSSDGVSTRFEYNNLDLPTLIGKSDGTIERLKYDEQGFLIRRERSATDWEEFSYDNAGRIEVRRRPPAAEEHYSYDEADRVVQVKYSNGREVNYGYDPSGKMISESWTSGEKRGWRYDVAGRVAEAIDAAGLSTTYSYDGQGRLSAVEDPLHGRTVLQHSARGKTIDRPAFGKSIYETTATGEPLSIIQANRQTVFRYDPRGWLQAIIPSSRLTWRYEHDPTGKLLSVTSPGGLKTTLSRDAAGRLTSVARGTVAWRHYQYDSAGRLDQEFSAAGNAARYKYDADGRLKELVLPDGTIAYHRDKSGRQSSIKGPGYEIQENYDGTGELDRRTYDPAKLDLKLPRDSQGRLAGFQLNAIKIAHAYDARGRIDRVDLPGGAAIKISYDEAGRPGNLEFGSAATLKIAYDQADRITLLEAKQASGKTIFGERYSYDAIGNLTGLALDSNPPRTLEYDRDDRLVKVTGGKGALGFQYDSDGNLSGIKTGDLMQRWVLDKMGRPTQQGAASFSWDAAGNLTRSENTLAKVANDFDAADRLVRRTNGKNSWSFSYLPDGDRLWKEGPSGKMWFAYLQDRLAGFKDERGTSWLLVCLPGTDRPIALCGSDGRMLFVVADRLASARRFLDPNGAVIASVDYGPFGNVEASTGASPIGLFAGMVRDETGLFYARRRYYDPQATRFVSIDPVISGYAPAAQNAYIYAGNNPYRYRDPLGTDFYEIWEHATFLHEEFGPGGGRDQLGLHPSVSQASFTPEELQKLNTLKDQYEQAERLVQGGPNVSAAALKQKALDAQWQASEQLRKLTQHVDDRIETAQRNLLQRTGDGAQSAENAINRGTFKKGTDTQQLAGNAVPPAGKGTQLISTPSVGEAGAASQNLPVPANQSGAATGQAAGDGAAGPNVTSSFEDDALYQGKPGITKDGKILGEAGEGAKEAGKIVSDDIGMKWNPKNGNWEKVGTAEAAKATGGKAASFAGEEMGERWLGPKVLQGGGKVLTALEPLLGPLLEANAAVDAALAGGWAAKNYIDTLNQPFTKEQADKAAASALAKEFADKLRQLGAADPNAIIMPDGRKFDPANPKDVDDLMSGLSQNIFFSRKPFDGLLKYVPKVPVSQDPTTFMGPAEGDTAADTTLESAWQLLQTGLAAEKAANEAAKECIQQQAEAQSQLQSAVTIAGARAVVESDVATAPETANDVKTQTAAVKAQTKSLQAAFEEMTAAVGKCDDAATKICEYAQQAASATEEQINTWRTDATAELFSASSLLNAAEAKIDATDGSVGQLRTSTAQLEGFRTSLWLYQGASKVGEAADASADGALAAAKAAAAKATAARGKLGPLLEQVRAIPPKISKLLAPYLASNLNAVAYNIAGQNLGRGIAEPGLFDFGALLTMASPVIDAALANQKAVEKGIGKIDLDGIVSAAHDAITAAENMRGSASALASGPDRYRPLQTASQCFALIKSAADKTASTSPKPEQNTAAEKAVVPDLSGFEGIPQMQAVISHAGLVGKFAAVKPDNKEQEFKYAGQFPRAGSEADKGDIVVVSFYQKFEDATAETSSAASGSSSSDDTAKTAPGTMPTLIGLTLDQATTRLSSNMSIGGDEIGSKPPTPEQALTIYAQNPAAGSKIAGDKKVVVTVKRYGSAKEAPPEETPASGGEQASSGSDDWVGTWGTPGTKAGDAITIGRDSDGYVLSGALVGKGPPLRQGVVQGGQLLFHTELDPADVVGIAIGGARSEAKGKKELFQLNVKFVRQGDTLDLDLESIEPGGKTTRQDFKGLRRMK